MEEYIKYETAKICKDKGIDLPHTHYYIYPFRSFKADGELKKNAVPDDHNDNIRQVVKSRKMQPQIAPAYTQAQLQKYFRDEYEIYVETCYDYYPKEGVYQFYTNWGYMNPDTIKKKQSGSYDEYNDWKNYEDALEFGLQKALEMITKR